jgi:hypothetical protein
VFKGVGEAGRAGWVGEAKVGEAGLGIVALMVVAVWWVVLA